MYALHLVDQQATRTELQDVAYVVAHATVDGTEELVTLVAYGPEAAFVNDLVTGAGFGIETDSIVRLLTEETAYLVDRASALAA